MPYRIAVTFDIPDQADGPTTKTAQVAFRALQDIEEVVGRCNGDTQYDDVEWYGFEPNADELTQNSWTYADEEILDQLTWRKREVPDLDVPEFLSNECEDENQAVRVEREFERREEQSGLAAHIRYLDEILESLPAHDPRLHAIQLYLREQLRNEQA